MASVPLLRVSSTTPHFFKIILDDTSKHKLKIPKKFVMKYGKDLSSSVCLKLPSGSEWEVELTRCKGKIWFEKGWPEFFMFCSLDYGSFLVFRYEGNSHFRVCIFDMSATEVDYPITIPKIDEAEDLSIEILEDFQLNPKTIRKSPVPYPPHEKMRTSFSGKAEMLSESEKTQPCCDMFEKPITDEESYCRKLQAKSMENKEKDGSVTRGSSGTQKLLNQTSLKSLPLNFAKRHFIKRPASNITLQILDGRTWSVEFTYSEEEARFQEGWLTFVKDNNLEVGDVCVFVLIKDFEQLLRVNIFHTSEATNWFLFRGRNSFPTQKDGGNSSGSQTFLKPTTPHEAPSRMKQLTVTEKADAFKSDKPPSFRIALQPSYIERPVMSIPNEFAKRYLMNFPADIAILKVLDGRTWHVKFKYDHANSRGRLMKGWLPFVRENNLKVGDVCVFTLVNSIELLFEVVFFPTTESANCSSPTGHGIGSTIQNGRTESSVVKVEPECSLSCEIGFNLGNNMSKTKGQVTQMPSSSLRTSRVNLEAASKFSPKNPFFKVTLGSGHSLHVPDKFARSFIKHVKQTGILQVKDRSWHVNLIPFKKPRAISICGGWAAFIKENCLREGDVCIFELMEMIDIVLKVHIFRCCLEGK
uniref:B3 domain-containing protein LOC_Os12g40080-like isoform X2 n=1 Tax=Fragaria vesca subsp. vesca TaxID=101020 RepID=UPI0005CB3C0E|nr:PREDICTED: B3 domain-containing protein LOC_Os12g40080-like isoform X2 [Fragaria vesca subsp. vesca]